ncbi:hypothetical protein OSTOST_01153 [Ostertagia ostertagi]
MSTGDLPPRFQLALRRSLFFGICFCFWLLVGTLCFSLLSAVGQRRVRYAGLCLPSFTDVGGMVKLDAKRTELLNVLWAETISKSEADWAEMANQKLEMYEKALLNYLGYRDDSNDRSFMGSLRKTFSLTTTIGPMNIAAFNTAGKAFAILYTLIGVPLCLLLRLTIVEEMIRLYERESSRKMRTNNIFFQGRALLMPVLGFIFVSAIIYDIIEDGTDDVPFVDAIFSIFLQFSAIGEMDSKFHGIIPYVIIITGVAMMSAVFSQMQHELERSVHGLEFTFSKSVYINVTILEDFHHFAFLTEYLAIQLLKIKDQELIFSNFERWMSEGKGSVNTNRIEEEDEEESDY